MAENLLYYGDNLDILRRYVADDSVDLVYLDPPFKSNQDYNVLFAEQDGSRAAAQIKAFEDTWRWDTSAALSFQEVVESGGPVSQAMQAFRTFLGENDLLAYLAMMAPRLIELRRVLKPTGSIYLHCDPTASHYLKILMDGVFGPLRYRNDIIWWRSRNPKGSQHESRRFGVGTDNILFYTKSDDYCFEIDNIKAELTTEELESKYPRIDEHGRYADGPILRSDSMGPRPNLVYEYKGFTPGPAGWRMTESELRELDSRGDIGWSPSGAPRRRLRPRDDRGTPVGSLWPDIAPLNSQAAERLGYPTQKPEELLERIITVSSKAGDVLLDPFCGCGTAIASAQRFRRQWIGIDITHLAITLIKHRLRHAFGNIEYKTLGEPVSVHDAQALADSDRYQFQWWALGLVGARPTEQKKGADKGIDGRLYFHDEDAGKTKQVILSVKSGTLKAQDVRDLRGVLERERAEIAVLLTMEEPTKPMRAEAASAGFYESVWGKKKHPKLQILTVGELLAGKGIDMPPIKQTNVTFKKAPRAKGKTDVTPDMYDERIEPKEDATPAEDHGRPRRRLVRRSMPDAETPDAESTHS